MLFSFKAQFSYPEIPFGKENFGQENFGESLALHQIHQNFLPPKILYHTVFKLFSVFELSFEVYTYHIRPMSYNQQ